MASLIGRYCKNVRAVCGKVGIKMPGMVEKGGPLSSGNGFSEGIASAPATPPQEHGDQKDDYCHHHIEPLHSAL
jgi:hypothetical protein